MFKVIVLVLKYICIVITPSLVVYKIVITAGLASICEVAALFSPHG